MFDHLADRRRRIRLSPLALVASAAAHLALVAWLVVGAERGPPTASSAHRVGSSDDADADGAIGVGGVRTSTAPGAGDGGASSRRGPSGTPSRRGAQRASGEAAPDRADLLELRADVRLARADGDPDAGAAAGASSPRTPGAPARGVAVGGAARRLEAPPPPPAGDGDDAASARALVEVPVGEPFRFRAVVHLGAAAGSGPPPPDADVDDATSELPRSPDPPGDALASPRVRRALLTGDGMEVRAESSPPRDSAMAPDTAAWSWTVIPRQPGVRAVRLEVVGGAADDTLAADTTLAARTVYVAVRTAEPPAPLRWLWDGWRWVAAVLLIAWVVRRRRRARRERRIAAALNDG